MLVKARNAMIALLSFANMFIRLRKGGWSTIEEVESDLVVILGQ